MPAFGWVYPTFAYFNGHYVAVTSTGSSGNANRIHHSYDGIEWTYQDLPDGYNVTDGANISYGNNKFIILIQNSPSKYLYSTDGLTWNKGTELSLNNLNKIKYVNDKFIMFSSYSNEKGALYSYDGINWTQFTINCSDMYKDIVYGDGIYILRTYACKNIMYSLDGIEWTKLNLNSENKYNDYICYGNGKFIISSTGDTDNIMYATSTSLLQYLIAQMVPKNKMLDTCYPINSVYSTTDKDFKPGDTFGGTWESITSGIDGVYMWKRTE